MYSNILAANTTIPVSIHITITLHVPASEGDIMEKITVKI